MIKENVEINLPPEAVWTFMFEEQNFALWNPGVLESKITPDGPIGVNTIIQNTHKLFRWKRVVNLRITHYELNKNIEFEFTFWHFKHVKVRYLLEPTRGKTSLTRAIEAETSGFWKLIQPIFDRMWNRDKGSLANVKSVVEAQLLTKKPLTDEALREWDVVRRTLEFFDGTLGNLRTVGLTASVTLIGIALQFGVYPLFLAAAFLNFAMLVIDRRYQAFLKVTGQYAMRIENAYCFPGEGLTFAITKESKRQGIIKPEHTFVAIYTVLFVASVISFLYFFHPNILSWI